MVGRSARNPYSTCHALFDKLCAGVTGRHSTLMRPAAHNAKALGACLGLLNVWVLEPATWTCGAALAFADHAIRRIEPSCPA